MNIRPILIVYKSEFFFFLKKISDIFQRFDFIFILSLKAYPVAKPTIFFRTRILLFGYKISFELYILFFKIIFNINLKIRTNIQQVILIW